MSKIAGTWYSKGSSSGSAADLYSIGDQTVVEFADGETLSVQTSSVRVSERILNTPRRLYLPDGSLFETSDNDAVDHTFATIASSSTLAHRIESRWKIIVALAIPAIFLGIIIFRSGIPWLGRELASSLPPTATDKIGEETLNLLDRFIFEKTSLGNRRQARFRERFHNIVTETDFRDETLRLHFRRLSDPTPNAFALPSGDIVVTDAFIKLVGRDRGFEAVLLHEIGHIHHRHGLQSMARMAVVGAAVTVFLGEVTGIEEFILAAPVFFTQTAYSREFETEADSFAFAQMQRLGIDTIHFAKIMEKMEAFQFGENATDNLSDDQPQVFDYWSSHPPTDERIRRAKERSTRSQSQEN